MQIVEFESFLRDLGLRKADLARLLDIHPVTISRWEEAPGYVLAYLRLLKEHQDLKKAMSLHLDKLKGIVNGAG
jgi:plasmid maintenance system antidote protein VapI